MLENNSQNPLLSVALDYAANGTAIFPVKERGKSPLTKNGFKDASTDPEKIAGWWGKWPNANIGLPTGEVNKVWVLDIDGDEGKEAFDGLVAEHGEIPETSQSITGNGRHIIFKHPGEKVKNSVRNLGKGLDVRGDGGYIVAPPSIHPTGHQYKWDPGLQDCLPTDAPDWLLKLVVKNEPTPPPPGLGAAPDGEDQEYAATILEETAATLATTSSGARNASLNSAAFKMGHHIAAGNIERAPVEVSLLHAAERNCLVVEDGEAAARKTIQSGIRAALENPQTPYRPLKHALTDIGNAERFIAQHGANLRFCFKWKRWLAWDSRRWSPDAEALVLEKAKATAVSITAEAKAATKSSHPRAEQIVKWAKRSQAKERIKALVELARSALPISPDNLDKDGWVLNCQNGTLDLRTGELRRHAREDLITKMAPVDFDPNATCPLFGGVIARATGDDAELAAYMQRSLGYALTSDTSEECLFVWHGTGRNGKGTILETVRAAMGDYASTTPVATLLQKGGSGIPNDLAALRGIRLVLASEINEGQKMDEALVKGLTGGDNISARFLHGEFFEFRPEFKIVLQTNYRPGIRGIDEGIWSRMRLVPFTVTVPTEERDRGLKKKIQQTELPGVFYWLLAGCLAWQKQGGLNEPDAVKQATAGYRKEEDSLFEFLEADTITAEDLHEPPDRVTVACTTLYSNYEYWCERNGVDAAPKWLFGRWMKGHGFSSKSIRLKGAQPHKAYIGLRPRVSDDPSLTEPRLNLVNNSQ
jgi:putative DNA primase/helicase